MWGYVILLFLSAFAPLLGVHYLLSGAVLTRELIFSSGILLINLGLVGVAMARMAPKQVGGALGFGLLLIGIKLFVNVFTILILIGLHAVEVLVFVCQFFAGYLGLMISSIWALNRTT